MVWIVFLCCKQLLFDILYWLLSKRIVNYYFLYSTFEPKLILQTSQSLDGLAASDLALWCCCYWIMPLMVLLHSLPEQQTTYCHVSAIMVQLLQCISVTIATQFLHSHDDIPWLLCCCRDAGLVFQSVSFAVFLWLK